jgi:thiosulfate dehydrogenase [quinone] large subunit
MQKFFRKRYEELGPTSYRGKYLKYFAIPFYKPVAWVLVPSQLIIALGMVSGTATRKNGALSLFILLNIAAGGYGDLTLPPFIVYGALASVIPSGQWMGFDRTLQKRYPNSALFR